MQKFNNTKKNICLDKMNIEGPPQEVLRWPKWIHVEWSLSSCSPINNDVKLPEDSKIHAGCLHIIFIYLCIYFYKIHLYRAMIRLT